MTFYSGSYLASTTNRYDFINNVLGPALQAHGWVVARDWWVVSGYRYKTWRNPAANSGASHDFFFTVCTADATTATVAYAMVHGGFDAATGTFSQMCIGIGSGVSQAMSADGTWNLSATSLMNQSATTGCAMLVTDNAFSYLLSVDHRRVIYNGNSSEIFYAGLYERFHPASPVAAPAGVFRFGTAIGGVLWTPTVTSALIASPGPLQAMFNQNTAHLQGNTSQSLPDFVGGKVLVADVFAVTRTVSSPYSGTFGRPFDVGYLNYPGIAWGDEIDLPTEPDWVVGTISGNFAFVMRKV